MLLAALEGIALDEGSLKRMQPASIRQPLYGCDFGAIQCYGELEAGIDPASIDQPGASNALPMVIAFLIQ